MIRIKVSPQGAIVVYEAESNDPNGPWFCTYHGDQMFYTDDEVKDWADWGPIDSPRAVPQGYTETVMVAKDIKAGMQVMYRGFWEPVKEAGYRDVMQRLLWLGERKRPITFTPYEPLAVRLNKEDGK